MTLMESIVSFFFLLFFPRVRWGWPPMEGRSRLLSLFYFSFLFQKCMLYILCIMVSFRRASSILNCRTVVQFWWQYIVKLTIHFLQCVN